ncbi:MAG TPA: TIM barrel protein [Herpetosiphonaceae bacterium]
MIELSLPLHADWTGGLTTAAYLDRLLSLGITAVEVQLPPTLRAEDIDRWAALIDQARERRLKLALHAPLAADSPIWSHVLTWIGELATTPVTLIVHGCTATRRAPDLVAQTVAYVYALLTRLPPTVTVAVEQSWNKGAAAGLGGMIRNLRGDKLQGRIQRPIGVGSGMGVASQAAPQPVPPATEFDPWLKSSRWRMLRRTDGFSGTGTRQETLQVVMEVNHPNCVIAWDVAHDWLGGAKGGVADWQSAASADFLRRVAYVRLHDVDDSGTDHWPLVVGNVPYASQLRPLLQHGFAGVVCLAIRYTPQTHMFGDRWHVLERSLAIARQVFRIN